MHKKTQILLKILELYNIIKTMEKNSKFSYKIIIKKLFLWLLVFIWMILVFNFSNESGNISSNRSGNVIKHILNLFFYNIDNEKIDILVENLQTLIRKFAHFTLYFIGGILSYIAFFCTYNNKEINDKKNKTETYSILFCFIYATSDEIHQYFIPGRSCRVFDVVIDILGALFAIVLCNLIRFFLENKNRKKFK